MTDFKTISVVFVVLTVLFGAATGYLVAFPPSQSGVTTKTIGAPSFTVGIAYRSGIGFFLTNGTGFALYFRSTDTPGSGKTTCASALCEKNWPVFYAAALSLAPGLNSTDFGVITAYNSTKIVTYDGYPLFYWIGDSKPGDTLGQGIGSFYVATVPAPVAHPVTTSSSSTTSTTSTSATPYGY